MVDDGAGPPCAAVRRRRGAFFEASLRRGIRAIALARDEFKRYAQYSAWRIEEFEGGGQRQHRTRIKQSQRPRACPDEFRINSTSGLKMKPT
jgi:hypothetical protein